MPAPTAPFADTDFAEYADAARARGFEETLVRRWEADVLVPEHRHPFSVEALVVQGEMWLTAAGDTRHLVPGDCFAVDRDAPHSERYGPEGATFWAARRHRP